MGIEQAAAADQPMATPTRRWGRPNYGSDSVKRPQNLQFWDPRWTACAVLIISTFAYQQLEVRALWGPGDVPIERFPYLVKVYNKIEWKFCNAFLIYPQYILTHDGCVNGHYKMMEDYEVLFRNKQRKITTVHHPAVSGLPSGHRLALCKLDKPVHDVQVPILPPDNTFILQPGQWLMGVGFVSGHNGGGWNVSFASSIDIPRKEKCPNNCLATCLCLFEAMCQIDQDDAGGPIILPYVHKKSNQAEGNPAKDVAVAVLTPQRYENFTCSLDISLHLPISSYVNWIKKITEFNSGRSVLPIMSKQEKPANATLPLFERPMNAIYDWFHAGHYQAICICVVFCIVLLFLTIPLFRHFHFRQYPYLPPREPKVLAYCEFQQTDGQSCKLCIFPKKIGDGGYGTIRKGQILSGKWKGEQVAVKSLCQNTVHALETLKVEIEFYKKVLPHENILTFFGSGECNGYPFLVVELMDIDLKKFRRESSANSLKFDDLLYIFSCVAKAMNYLLEHHYVHNDLKPDNILLRKHHNSYVVKIADFGSSELKSRTHGPAELKGKTLGYCDGVMLYYSRQLEVNYFKCDVYSFGRTITAYILGVDPLTRYMTSIKVNSADMIPEELYNFIKRCTAEKSETQPTWEEAYTILSTMREREWAKWKVPPSIMPKLRICELRG